VLRALAPTPDPELRYLKEQHGADFKEAFQKALAELPPKQRNVLALYYIDGLKSTAIAAMYGVQGVTVRAWLKAARDALLSSTESALSDRLGLSSSELRSLIALVRSQIDLTLSRALRAPASEP
jgi:RNA polymerase sigma-70 factor (ECF subfamily)